MADLSNQISDLKGSMGEFNKQMDSLTGRVASLADALQGLISSTTRTGRTERQRIQQERNRLAMALRRDRALRTEQSTISRIIGLRSAEQKRIEEEIKSRTQWLRNNGEEIRARKESIRSIMDAARATRDGARAARDSYRTVKQQISSIKDFVSGLPGVGTVISTLGTVVTSVISDIQSLNKALSMQSKTFGLTRSQMKGYGDVITSIRSDWRLYGITLGEASDAQTAVLNEYRDMSVGTRKELIATVAVMQELGVSADDAAVFARNLSENFGISDEELIGVVEKIGQISRAPAGLVLKDMAASSSLMALRTGNMVDDMIMMSDYAVRTGQSTEGLVNWADNFVTNAGDMFNQLAKIQVSIGKDVNLEGYRSLMEEYARGNATAEQLQKKLLEDYEKVRDLRKSRGELLTLPERQGFEKLANMSISELEKLSRRARLQGKQQVQYNLKEALTSMQPFSEKLTNIIATPFAKIMKELTPDLEKDLFDMLDGLQKELAAVVPSMDVLKEIYDEQGFAAAADAFITPIWNYFETTFGPQIGAMWDKYITPLLTKGGRRLAGEISILINEISDGKFGSTREEVELKNLQLEAKDLGVATQSMDFARKVKDGDKGLIWDSDLFTADVPRDILEKEIERFKTAQKEGGAYISSYDSVRGNADFSEEGVENFIKSEAIKEEDKKAKEKHARWMKQQYTNPKSRLYRDPRILQQYFAEPSPLMPTPKEKNIPSLGEKSPMFISPIQQQELDTYKYLSEKIGGSLGQKDIDNLNDIISKNISDKEFAEAIKGSLPSQILENFTKLSEQDKRKVYEDFIKMSGEDLKNIQKILSETSKKLNKKDFENKELYDWTQDYIKYINDNIDNLNKIPQFIRKPAAAEMADKINISANAKGGVYNRPTLAMIGEEGRDEVVIPTGRIRDGLPINSAVASQLSSIGVPGFFAGGMIESSMRATQSRRSNVASQAMYASGGDPASIRKREQDMRNMQEGYINDLKKHHREVFRREMDLSRYNRRTSRYQRDSVSLFGKLTSAYANKLRNLYEPGTFADAVATGLAKWLETGKWQDGLRAGFDEAMSDIGFIYKAIKDLTSNVGAEAAQGAYVNLRRWEEGGMQGGWKEGARLGALGAAQSLLTTRYDSGEHKGITFGMRMGRYLFNTESDPNAPTKATQIQNRKDDAFTTLAKQMQESIQQGATAEQLDLQTGVATVRSVTEVEKAINNAANAQLKQDADLNDRLREEIRKKRGGDGGDGDGNGSGGGGGTGDGNNSFWKRLTAFGREKNKDTGIMGDFSLGNIWSNAKGGMKADFDNFKAGFGDVAGQAVMGGIVTGLQTGSFKKGAKAAMQGLESGALGLAMSSGPWGMAAAGAYMIGKGIYQNWKRKRKTRSRKRTQDRTTSQYYGTGSDFANIMKTKGILPYNIPFHLPGNEESASYYLDGVRNKVRLSIKSAFGRFLDQKWIEAITNSYMSGGGQADPVLIDEAMDEIIRNATAMGASATNIGGRNSLDMSSLSNIGATLAAESDLFSNTYGDFQYYSGEYGLSDASGGDAPIPMDMGDGTIQNVDIAGSNGVSVRAPRRGQINVSLDGNGEIVNKLDRLIEVTNQPPIVNLDGRQVTRSVNNRNYEARNGLGIR